MANEKAQNSKIVTGKVRISYANLVTPKADEKGELKYGCAVLIPKSDTATLTRIKAAIDSVKKDPGSIQKWGCQFHSEMKLPLRDGDAKAEANPEYAGHYFFNCSSKQKPGIVDVNTNPIIDASEVYSGMYARVSVNFFAFNNKGNKGIGAGLQNVQKLADGESLGGGRSRPEDDFGDSVPADDFLG